MFKVLILTWILIAVGVPQAPITKIEMDKCYEKYTGRTVGRLTPYEGRR